MKVACSKGKVAIGYKCTESKPIPKSDVTIDFKNGGTYTNAPATPPIGNRDLMSDYVNGGAYTNAPK